MTAPDGLERGRTAFEQRAWRDAYDQLSAADLEAPFAPDDLVRLATAAHMVGQETDSVDAWARAYHEFLNQDDAAPAARCAFG